MVRFIVVCHGETTWNREHRLQGKNNIPLTQRGILQAMALAKRLKSETIDVAYSSPLDRALDTARIILKPHRLVPIPEVALQEISFGRLEGKSYEEIMAENPDFDWGTGSKDPLNWKIEGGESLKEKIDQLDKRFSFWIKAHKGQTVFLSTYGGVKRALAVYTRYLPPEKAKTVAIHNKAVSLVRFKKKGYEVELFISFRQAFTGRNL